MRKVINTILCLAMLITVAYATTSITFSSGTSIVTQAEPTTVDIQTNAVGDLHVWARFDGKGADLDITGPASCGDSSGRFKEVFCTIPNAPVGSYHITVAPKGNYSIQNVGGTISGEIVFIP